MHEEASTLYALALELLAGLEPSHLELIKLLTSVGNCLLLRSEGGEVGGVDGEHPLLKLLDLAATRLHFAFERSNLLR